MNRSGCALHNATLRDMKAPDDGEALDMIEAWLDEHGWDQLGTDVFKAWLESVNIDIGRIRITLCVRESEND